MSGMPQQTRGAAQARALPLPAGSFEVGRLSRAAWERLLDCFEDASIYQSYAWAAVRWGAERIEHALIRQGGTVAAAAQLWLFRLPPLGCGIAHLKWGPLFRPRGGGGGTEAFRCLVRGLREEYVERRRLLLRIVPPAFDPAASELKAVLETEGFRPSATAERYRTFILPLAPSIEELEASLKPKWRQHLRHGRRSGLEVEEGEGEGLVAEVGRLYREMKRRKRFADFLPFDDVAAVHRELPAGGRMLAMVARTGGRPVAGLLGAHTGGVAVPLVAATAPAGLKLCAAYRLEWGMIERMRAAGCRWYDLGGIDPVGYPGPYRYKAGLAGRLGREVTFQAFDSGGGAASRMLGRAADGLRRTHRKVREALRR